MPFQVTGSQGLMSPSPLASPRMSIGHIYTHASIHISFLKHFLPPTFSKPWGWESEVKIFLANRKRRPCETHLQCLFSVVSVPCWVDRRGGGAACSPPLWPNREGQQENARGRPGAAWRSLAGQRAGPAPLSFPLPSSRKDKLAGCQQRTAKAVVFL